MISIAPRTRRRLRRALAALLAAVACAGCAAVEHAVQTSEYAGEPLSPRSARGAERYRAELAVDSTLQAFVAEHGRPDYFYVVGRHKLYLFYVKTDRAFMFERVLVEGSQLTELGRIPGSLVKLLPSRTRARIEATRASEQRRAQAKARSSKKRIATRGVPASKGPGGTYIGGFEVDEIVARMKPPLTAADPGVSNWKRSKRRNGPTAYFARVGGTSYEVTLERVAFTVRLSASRKYLPGSARLAMQRVNAAIFGANANAVTQQMMKLAERSVADRSGRTVFHKRVAGRTIRIARRVDKGVFAYSVHP